MEPSPVAHTHAPQDRDLDAFLARRLECKVREGKVAPQLPIEKNLTYPSVTVPPSLRIRLARLWEEQRGSPKVL